MKIWHCSSMADGAFGNIKHWTAPWTHGKEQWVGGHLGLKMPSQYLSNSSSRIVFGALLCLEDCLPFLKQRLSKVRVSIANVERKSKAFLTPFWSFCCSFTPHQQKSEKASIQTWLSGSYSWWYISKHLSCPKFFSCKLQPHETITSLVVWYTGTFQPQVGMKMTRSYDLQFLQQGVTHNYPQASPAALGAGEIYTALTVKEWYVLHLTDKAAALPLQEWPSSASWNPCLQ